MFLAGMSVCPSVVCAQAVGLEATVNEKTVPLGGALQYTLTVTNATGVDPVVLPDIDGMETRYIGPSTQVSIVNGHYSSSTAFRYQLFPQKTGTFTIPAVELQIEGQTLRAEPITIEVTAGGGSGAAAAPGGAGPSSAGGGGTTLSDKLFLTFQIPQKTFYLNERIPVRVQLFVNGLDIRDVSFPSIQGDGFMMEDFPQPQRTTQVVGGLRYDVLDFQTFLYPTRPGRLSLGPVQETVNLVFRSPSDRRSLGGLFDEDLFGGLFDRVDVRPFGVEAAGRTVDVLPLPEAGKPDNFSGAVGDFQFQVTVSPSQVRVGDPVTLRMAVSGNGNLSPVEFPKVPAGDDFKTYDPEVSEHNGVKVLEQIIIPTHDEVSELGPVTLTYFNPQSGTYESLTRGPFPLIVDPLPEGEELKVVGMSGAAPAILKDEELGRDISFIKGTAGDLKPVGRRVYHLWWYWVMAAALGAAWLAAVVNYHFNRRLQTDTRFARRLRAPRTARQGLAAVRDDMSKGEGRAFYDRLHKTLSRYFADKYHLPAGAVTPDRVRGAVRREVPEKYWDSLRTLLERCEAARFAAASVPDGQLTDDYQKAAELIDYFERKA